MAVLENGKREELTEVVKSVRSKKKKTIQFKIPVFTGQVNFLCKTLPEDARQQQKGQESEEGEKGQD